MVPSNFVVLDALPLTPNGKVDRKALPAPDQARADWHGTFIAPSNPTEDLLARLWGEVLGIDRVGIHDNFFDLGGHSLQAVQLVSRASKALGCEVPVKALFLYPTVAALAEAVNNPPACAGVPNTRPDMPTSASLGSHLDELGSRVTIERRPLLPLFESGVLAPADSAAIGYLPSAVLDYTGLSAREIIDGWCGNRPVVSGVYQTPLGRIALMLLPRFDSQLYQDPDDLLDVLRHALDTCRQLGARTVSLTGLLPSATRYGMSLRDTMGGVVGPKITSGHATTTAAVVLAVRRILTEAGRDLSRERVGFLGLGSIGTATLRTLLRCSPHPEEIRLCDVYGKREALHGLRRELIETLGYRGAVYVLESRGKLSADLYDSTLIIGATNVPDVLDVDRLAPGTLLVDDSSPHCFRLDRAVRRLRSRHDVLFTEGGTLHAPEALGLLAYVPAGLEQVAQSVPAEFFANYNSHRITGCVLSGLLSATCPDLPATVGPVEPDACLAHLGILEELSFEAAGLHGDSFELDHDSVEAFRLRFGRGECPS
jgi:acyl carrier protein